MIRSILMFAGLCSVAGCAVSPAYKQSPPIEAVATAATYQEYADSAAPAADPVDWWGQMGGPALTGLVDELLNRNLSIMAAEAQYEQARARAAQSGGARLPSISGSGSATRSRSATAGGSAWSETYQAGLNSSWDLDIFGELRTAHRSATLTAQASALSLQSVRQQQIVALARAWANAITLDRRLKLTRQNAENINSTYELTDGRYRAGSQNASASDVQVARQNAESAFADIPDLEAQLRIQLDAIDVLLGRLPGQARRQFDGTWQFQDVPAVPVGTPIDLLSRRPDIRAAELRYRAALQDVGSARAQLLPALSLTASLTFQDGEVSNLFDADDYLASLAGSLTAPIFNGGRLRAQVRQQQGAAKEQAANFANAALNAVADVEAALANEQAAQDRVERLTEAARLADIANQLAQDRYRAGLNTLLSVLDTQRSLNSARQNLALAEQSRINARIDLYLSLGGVWFDDLTTIPAVMQQFEKPAVPAVGGAR